MKAYLFHFLFEEVFFYESQSQTNKDLLNKHELFELNLQSDEENEIGSLL